MQSENLNPVRNVNGSAELSVRSLEAIRVAVVMINYHGLEDTLECLQSCMRASDSAVDIIVVDNNSGNNEAEKVSAAFPNVTVIAHDHNAGWSGGNNLGIRCALARNVDWVLLLNNDTTVSADLFRVMRLATDSGCYHILGPVINEYSSPKCIQTEGVCFNPRDHNSFFARVPVVPVLEGEVPVVPCDIVNGCAVMISRQVFDAIGLIDEQFFLICEESDFCLRALKAGFRCGVVARSLVWHKHSVSFARAGNSLQRYYGTRNLGLLIKKHPHIPGRRGNWKSRIAYYRYAWHLYCHDRERGGIEGAKAVAEGLVDFWLRRFGKRRKATLASGVMARSVDHFMYAVWRLRAFGKSLKQG